MPPHAPAALDITALDIPSLDVPALTAAGHLDPTRGPLLRAACGAPTSVNTRLLGAWRRGELVRIATGVYLPTPRWAALAPWDRYTLAAAAFALGHPATVWTGLTAASLHGLPLAETPDELHHRAPSRGHRGRQPLARRHVAVHAAATPRLAVPAPPYRRARWNPPSAPDDVPQSVEIALTDGTLLGTVLADPLPSIQLQLAAELPLRQALPPLDALALRHPAPADSWARDHADSLATARLRDRFRVTWGLVDARSESAGESVSRAVLHEWGFTPPDLQRTLFDAQGKAVARVDFWWEEAGVAGEFDGVVKYDVGLHVDEAARRTAIRDEKNREVRLQRVVRGLVRWTWDDLRDPAGLAAELRRHGVPMR